MSSEQLILVGKHSMIPSSAIKLIASISLISACVTSVYAQPVTQYEYDAIGNRTKLTDPLLNVTTYVYDALNRPIQQNQPNPASTGQLGQIRTEYNAIDQITKITDPRNLQTLYGYNAFGNVQSLTSPDTGNTVNTYDDAGNILTKRDAKNQTTTYTYDALNRLTKAVYADATEVDYTYDQGANGLGHLTGVVDSTGTIVYGYDTHGRVVNEARTINLITYTTTYAYTSTGQLTGIAYPTGLVLSYARDAMGRVTKITSTKNGQIRVLAQNVTYQPWGGVKSLAFGNGSIYTRGYDAESRLGSYKLGTQTINVDYDLSSRIIDLKDSVNTSDIRSYGYDNLDRLIAYTSPTTNQTYGYDLTGNRSSLTIGASSYSNTISSSSNQLLTNSGPVAKTYTTDANGSITADTINQFTYDTRGRLTHAVTPVGGVDYGVNSLGQRVIKTLGGVSTVFHYDTKGHLIAETDGAGVVKQEIIYFNDMLLAVIK